MTMKLRVAILLSALCAFPAFSAVEWRNLDEAHHLGGRKASEGYLCGKVVLVDRWGAKCPPCRAALPDVEKLWQSFKTKPFVVIGGHCAGWGDADQVKALIKENGITYPVYEDAGMAVGEPGFNTIPFIYVVDETGKVVYRGHGVKDATEAVVVALTDMEAPRDVTQWRRFLDFELENLPGRAYLRIQAAKKDKKFAATLKSEYAAKERELLAIPDVKKLAELVDFARKAKDMRTFGPKDKSKRARYVSSVKAAAKSDKYKKLLESEDPRVVREAKNAMADIKWTAASL